MKVVKGGIECEKRWGSIVGKELDPPKSKMGQLRSNSNSRKKSGKH
jgi:hypothetical protein